jgi:hypothetical protein
MIFPYKITQREPLGTVTVMPELIVKSPTEDADLPAVIV